MTMRSGLPSSLSILSDDTENSLFTASNQKVPLRQSAGSRKWMDEERRYHSLLPFSRDVMSHIFLRQKQNSISVLPGRQFHRQIWSKLANMYPLWQNIFSIFQCIWWIFILIKQVLFGKFWPSFGQICPNWEKNVSAIWIFWTWQHCSICLSLRRPTLTLKKSDWHLSARSRRH